MSKTTAKQRHLQLMEWLEVRKQQNGKTTPGSRKSTQRFSKADVYNKSQR